MEIDLVRRAQQGDREAFGVLASRIGDDAVVCDGAASFDGSTWIPYLPGLCVHDLDIAPDGSVWVRAEDYGNPENEWRGTGLVETYVIRPPGSCD